MLADISAAKHVDADVLHKVLPLKVRETDLDRHRHRYRYRHRHRHIRRDTDFVQLPVSRGVTQRSELLGCNFLYPSTVCVPRITPQMTNRRSQMTRLCCSERPSLSRAVGRGARGYHSRYATIAHSVGSYEPIALLKRDPSWTIVS